MNNNMNNINIIPIKSYPNSDKYKYVIFKENKGKSGIYRWNNLVTGKSYVGSAINLGNRLNVYYNFFTIEKLLGRGSSAIYRAVLKYGHYNFSLDILEYCESKLLIVREQYYINLLKPKYNILQTAGSRLGHKLSEYTKMKISIKNKGDKNFMFGKHHLDETKKKISESLKLYYKFNKITDDIRFKMNISKKGNKHPMFNNNHSDETKKKISESIKLYNKFNETNSLRSRGIKIKVFDNSGNLIKEFPSMRMAAIHFKVSHSTISKVLSRNLPYNGFSFKSEIINTKIWVYNKNNKLIKTFNTITATSKELSIPYATIGRYIKSSKLCKNKFYFYKNKIID